MKDKIIITDNNIDLNISNHISFKELSSDEFIKVYLLDILNDSNLEIEYNIKEEVKINFIINVLNGVRLNLIDKKNCKNIKVKCSYKLGENSSLFVQKINSGSKISEYDVIELNGLNSSVNYVLKTVCTNSENYDIVVNHLEKNTTSNIITNGINIENGKLQFNVTGFVPNGSSSSYLMQDNRIINFTNNKCQINPNLLIDEMNVEANHSAHISDFSLEDLFYIQSRGINYEEAKKLLIKGFLLSNLDDSISDYIDQLIKNYWG